MAAGLHAHQTLQQDQVVGRLQNILAVVQRQFVLARRIFGDQRLDWDALRLGAGIDVGKQRFHAVQMVDRVHLGLAAHAPVENGARRLDATVRVALVLEQEEFQFEGAGRMQPLRREGLNLARQSVARVRAHRLAVEMIHRQKHLAARRAGAVKRLQRARDRPGAQVAVAGIPDQAGFVDVLAGDVEAEDGDRHVAAALVDRQQLVAADDFSPANAVGVGEQDVEGLNVRMGIQKRLCFVNGRA